MQQVAHGVADYHLDGQLYLRRFLRAVRNLLHQDLYRQRTDIGYRLADVRYGRVDEVELYRVVERNYRNVLRYTQLRFTYRLYRTEQNRVAECENSRRRIGRIEREFGFEITVVDGKTVAATDLLVPGVGEIIGCSEREADYDKLITAMKKRNMPLDAYQDYLDTRKFGSVPHSGFGLGFDRLLMYIAGVQNIRDTLLFPRTVGKL